MKEGYLKTTVLLTVFFSHCIQIAVTLCYSNFVKVISTFAIPIYNMLFLKKVVQGFKFTIYVARYHKKLKERYLCMFVF